MKSRCSARLAFSPGACALAGTGAEVARRAAAGACAAKGSRPSSGVRPPFHTHACAADGRAAVMSGVQRMKVANERHSKSITQRGAPHRAPVPPRGGGYGAPTGLVGGGHRKGPAGGEGSRRSLAPGALCICGVRLSDA
ncbi:uncharacterized protein LOC102574501 isoform X2 [Alligator mississippiensis]|uniref:uncharacterized protein LOC102574501 isoform X2 n=1 Tax=Alligator mississippiensis TaxID=8496 RepID=UPI0028780A22|nr:uncharacterized protein LOC102574501 isoform X2 [Alligator mississippiensis]